VILRKKGELKRKRKNTWGTGGIQERKSQRGKVEESENGTETAEGHLTKQGEWERKRQRKRDTREERGLGHR
jgi:hypothetical protein